MRLCLADQLTIRRLGEASLALAGDRWLECIAKPVGVEPYRAAGFVSCGAVTKFGGTVSSLPPPSAVTIRVARPDELASLWALDRHASGIGRDLRVVLGELAKLGSTYVHEGREGIEGFALHVRAGSTVHIGPIVSRNEAIACALARPALTIGAKISLHTSRPVDGALGRMLTAAGVEAVLDPAKRAVRTIRGPAPNEAPDAIVYALAGSAMG